MPGAPGSAPVAHGSYTYQDLIRLWQQAGGSAASAPVAAAIAMAESGGRNVKQQGQPPATTGWGLWQITPGSPALLDPMANARAAVAKWKAAGGFTPWTTYTHGTYQKFLGTAKAAAASDSSSFLPGVSLPSIPNPLAPLNTIGDLIGLLTSGAFWLRVGEVIAGGLLILLGLHSLTGGSGSPVAAAATVLKHV